jgi:hypothetical protein
MYEYISRLSPPSPKIDVEKDEKIGKTKMQQHENKKKNGKQAVNTFFISLGKRRHFM